MTNIDCPDCGRRIELNQSGIIPYHDNGSPIVCAGSGRQVSAASTQPRCACCGAPATHEQCGGALACAAHIMPGRAWLIDSKTIELHAQAVGAVVLVAARAVASLGTFTVRGIVRKPSRTTRAGFVYFDLEDESGARLRCRAAGIEIASGALTVRGDLSVFVGTGDLQFNVVEIVP